MNAASLSSSSIFRQRWVLFGLVVFFLAIFLQFFLKVHRHEGDPRSAFKRWAPQILEVDQGVDIWHKHIYPNPPIMVLILKPLAHLSPAAGSLAWFLLKVVMAVLSIHWVLRMLDSGPRPFPVWGQALAILLSLRPIQGDLVHGNVNLFILFLVVGCLYAFHRGKDVLCGLVLALAIACKVTPALLVPYFIWKRAWKAAATSMVGLGLFIYVVPGFVLGFKENVQYFNSWVNGMVVPYVVKGEVWSEHNNQSLAGLAYRMLTKSPSFSDYVDDKIYTPLAYHNIAEWDTGTVRLLIKACLLVFALVVVWSCRTPTTDRSDWKLVAEYGLIILGMLLFSERTWKHHCVTLLVPFSAAAYALSTRWHDKTLRWYLLGTLALVVALMTATATGWFENHERPEEMMNVPGKLAQVYGAYVWAHALLMALMVVLLKRKETSATS